MIGTGGDDLVVSGTPGDPDAGDANLAAADDDDIRLGSGSSTIRLYGIPTGSLVGGDGTDTLLLRSRSETSWDVDLPAETFTVGDTAGRIVGIETFDLESTTWSSLTFAGSDRPETVYAGGQTTPENSTMTIDLGAGADSIALNPARLAGVDGGSGRDRAVYSLVAPGSGASVARGRATFADGDLTLAGYRGGALLSFADLTVSGARTVDVTGDQNANAVRAADACTARLDGRGGKDLLVGPRTGHDCDSHPVRLRLRARGGPGADVLRGGPGHDSLIGGRGRDVAVGAGGGDVCRAEVRRTC